MGRPKGSPNKKKSQTDQTISKLVEAVTATDEDKEVVATIQTPTGATKYVKIIYAGKHPITLEDVYIECQEE
jgi:hypothetical protein